MESMEKRWRDLVGKYGKDESTILEIYRDILRMYSRPARKYHNIHHLDYIFRDLDSIESCIPDSVLFAVWFHDYVYLPDQECSEKLSADAAVRILGEAGLPGDMLLDIKNLILSTEDHFGHYRGYGEQYLLDADIGILGASPDKYREYSIGISQEFREVPKKTYIEGRKKFLIRILEQERIYRTNYFFNKYEANARKNVLNELIQLLSMT